LRTAAPKEATHTLDFDEVGMPRLLSVNVGLPRDVTWNGKTVRTAVWKSPVARRRMVRKLDIDGDAQADRAGHGGEHRTVFVYQMDSVLVCCSQPNAGVTLDL
jgi:MOSC domain-containing protein YiiM